MYKEQEIEEFRKNFYDFRDKKIVIYGIGRLTASLLPGIADFNIVGLMDRDPENLGEKIYGFSIISISEAEKNADLIIINTATSYWDTIFSRICNISIPIYYRNGQKAQIREDREIFSELKYWNTSLEELKKKIMHMDFISFDLFDTLIMRKVYCPSEVFKIVETRIKKEFNIQINYVELRNEIHGKFSYKDYTLDEIYNELKIMTGLSWNELESIKNIELEVEEKLIVPRKDLIEACKFAIEHGKKVYILSDMYLPSIFLQNLLEQYKIRIEISNIWISGELNCNKSNGSMWDRYRTIIAGKTALHIGDNRESDIKQAEAKGITTYYIMKSADMLKCSSLRSLVPNICSNFASLAIGLVLADLFNSPFSLNPGKGKISINSLRDMGYDVYGIVILTFLLWMGRKANELEIESVYFFSRDGYFLAKDFKLLQNKLEMLRGINVEYLLISRRLITVAAIENKNDFEEILELPYFGEFQNYLFDRFEVRADLRSVAYNREVINTTQDKEKIIIYLKPYEKELCEEIKKEKKNYLKYLEKFNFEATFASVDLCFYGNTQYYLSKLLNKSFTGFYFAANLSNDNIRNLKNNMFPCFQDAKDVLAKSSKVFKNIQIIESFLTAPYGMVKWIDSQGNMVCEEEKENQRHFRQKELINEGVKEYIADFIRFYQWGIKAEIDIPFVDDFFGGVFDSDCVIDETISDSMWFDNGCFSRKQYRIFE